MARKLKYTVVREAAFGCEHVLSQHFTRKAADRAAKRGSTRYRQKVRRTKPGDKSDRQICRPSALRGMLDQDDVQACVTWMEKVKRRPFGSKSTPKKVCMTHHGKATDKARGMSRKHVSAQVVQDGRVVVDCRRGSCHRV